MTKLLRIFTKKNILNCLFLYLGEKTTLEFAEKFGKNKVHFIKCNVLEKDDIVNLYEVIRDLKG